MKLLNCWNPNNPWKTSLILILHSLDPLLIGRCHSLKSSELQILPLLLFFATARVWFATLGGREAAGWVLVTLPIPPLALSPTCPLSSTPSNFVLKTVEIRNVLDMLRLGFFFQPKYISLLFSCKNPAKRENLVGTEICILSQFCPVTLFSRSISSDFSGTGALPPSPSFNSFFWQKC